MLQNNDPGRKHPNFFTFELEQFGSSTQYGYF